MNCRYFTQNKVGNLHGAVSNSFEYLHQRIDIDTIMPAILSLTHIIAGIKIGIVTGVLPTRLYVFIEASSHQP